MLGNLVSNNSISYLLVFSEGLLSFFSPCVIPLIPIYMSYLAGNAKQVGEDGQITYQRKKVFFHTLFFILGISFAFFVLGMSFTALGSFFKSNQYLFTRIGGILIILLGLYQMGVFQINLLQRERKINLNFTKWQMNPLVAFIMGFTFSFAWTPCVGPALSSVLIMASGANHSFLGNFLVFLYTLGFTLPFLLLGLFTSQVLNFLKKNQKLLKYTVKAGGLILILIGLMTFTGWMNGISKYLNSFTPPSKNTQIIPENSNNENDADTSDQTDNNTSDPSGTDADTNTGSDSQNTTDNTADPDSGDSGNNTDTTDNNEETPNKKATAAPDFTLVDQYGNEHTLSDYKGKVVFLNFWATWCPPCKKEMPDIEALYQDYNLNKDDVIILGVANPSSDEYPNNQDVSKKEVTAFLEANNYTFPVVFDETGDLFSQYYISSFPTTFLIDPEGNVYGYASGMMTRDMMDNAIAQTFDSVK